MASERSRSGGVRSSRSSRPATSSSLRGTHSVPSRSTTRTGRRSRRSSRPVASHAPGAVGDDPEAIERALRGAAASADLVVTSGGVGRPPRPCPNVLERRGALDFWRIAVQPGKPLAVGELDGDDHRPARQSVQCARRSSSSRDRSSGRCSDCPATGGCASRRPRRSGHRRIAAGERSCGSCSAGPMAACTSRGLPVASSPPSSTDGRRERAPRHPRGCRRRGAGRRATRRSFSSRRHEADHLSDDGAPRMVDVGSKPVTARRALAEAVVRMRPTCSPRSSTRAGRRATRS